MMAPRLLRLFAIAIAVAAAIDPAVTSSRAARPVVAVVAADPRADAADAGRVAALLGRDHAVVGAPFPDASAVVVVGDRVPTAAVRAALPAVAPVFAVLPDDDAPRLRIVAVDAPARAPLDSRIGVVATIDAEAVRGRAVDVVLQQVDERGAVEVARETLRWSGADTVARIPLSFVPVAAGAAWLRVEARTAGDACAAPVAHADLLVDVRDDRWPILVFDRRPSWQSTFVRRSLARDPRFTVTSRIETSVRASSDAGRAPAGLDDPARLAPFAAIVVGAPESLTARDVEGLERWLRQRGGGALLLFDRDSAGPVDRLLGGAPWAVSRTRAAEPIALPGLVADSVALRAALVRRPRRLPDVAEALDVGPSQGIVWRRPVGAGHLLVNGALDAWQWRDPSQSAFDATWSTLVAELAAAAPDRVAVEVAQAVLAPGQETPVTVRLRDVALGASDGGPAGASTEQAVSAALVSGTTTIPIRLWPAPTPGELSGHLRAPATPGPWRLFVRAETGTAGSPDAARAELPLMVATDASPARPDERALLRQWAALRGGVALPSSRVAALPSELARVLRPDTRAVTWHPMRSPWWILPFALALAGEWWLRRRRGLA